MSLDARPTIAAPDDDPYLWLEEIEGERRSPGSRHRTRGRWRPSATAEFAADRDVARGDPRPARQDPADRRGAGRSSTISGRMPQHPRGLWRRTTLESFRIEQPALGNPARPRRAGGGGGRGLDLERRRDAAGHATTARSCACRAAAAMRWCCASSTLRRKTFVADGFVLPEAKGGASWLDADTLLLSSALGRRRHDVGLCPHGAAVAARHRRRRGAGALRGAAPSSMSASGRRRPHRGAEERSGSIDADRLLRRRGLAGDRSRTETQLDLPTDVQVECASRLARGQAAHGLDRRRQDLPGRHRCSASSSTPSSPASRDFTRAVRARPSGASLQGFFWSGGRLVLSILDDLQPVFEVLTPVRRRLDARERSPACRDIGVVECLAARCRALGESTAICWPARRTR